MALFSRYGILFVRLYNILLQRDIKVLRIFIPEFERNSIGKLTPVYRNSIFKKLSSSASFNVTLILITYRYNCYRYNNFFFTVYPFSCYGIRFEFILPASDIHLLYFSGPFVKGFPMIASISIIRCVHVLRGFSFSPLLDSMTSYSMLIEYPPVLS